SQQGLALTVVVTDAAGNQLATASDSVGSGGVSLANVPLTPGTNYITVFAAVGSAQATRGHPIHGGTPTRAPAPHGRHPVPAPPRRRIPGSRPRRPKARSPS